MGISLTIVAVEDAELLRLRAHPEELDQRFEEARPRGPRPSCYLSSYWRRVHALLTEERPTAGLPFCALISGDFNYPGAVDTTHALLSGATTEFASLLGRLTPEHVRAYFERRRVEAEARGPDAAPAIRWAATPTAVTQLTEELWIYLRQLHDLAAEAAAAQQGLLLCRWEDW